MPSLVVLLSIVVVATAGTTTFTVPTSPALKCATLDPAPIALSFEFYEFPSYFTNVSNTKSCMKHLHDLTDTWPRIRIGGTSQDRSTYVPGLEAYIVYSVPDPFTLATNITFGPRFIDLAAKYGGTVVMGLNRGGNNITNTIEAAQATEEKVQNLQAIELGNEPDIFPYLNFPVAYGQNDTWTPLVEATSESNWQLALASSLSNPTIIQAGNFELPPSSFNASNLIKYENPFALKTIKDFSHHNYPQSTYSVVDLPSLMSHVNIASNVDEYAADVEAAGKLGWEYVFGETNSVSGGGSNLTSPLFGSALWLLDYTLRAASTSIKRIYLHQCTIGDCWYSFWDRENVNAPFYGAYAAAYALAGGKYIQALDNGGSNYGGYVIFDGEGEVRKVVVLNSDYFAGNGSGTRSVEKVLLKGLKGRSVEVRRLTAENALVRVSEGGLPTFGGRWFEADCRVAGREKVEIVQIADGGVVLDVRASEALVMDIFV